MPSGAKKRKAAKKKQLNHSSTPNPNPGENANQELSSPTSQYPSVEVQKREDDSSETKSQNPNDESVSKSKNSHVTSSSSSDTSDNESHVVDKNVVVIEPAPNVPVPRVEPVPISSMPMSPIVDPIKPADPLLEEVSQVFDETKNENKIDTPLIVAEEQTVVVSEGSSVSKDGVSSSSPPKNLISEVNDDETDATGHSDKQAPATLTQRTTTWKSCCGIFELFSGSEK